MSSWLVTPGGKLVRMNRTEDLLTDGKAACEDVARALNELVQAHAISRRIVAASQRDRRMRSSRLRLVRQD